MKHTPPTTELIQASLSRKVAELKLKHGGWAMDLSALTLGFADTTLAMAGLPVELAANDRLNAELKFEMALIEDLLTDALEDLAERRNAGADAENQETDAVCRRIGAHNPEIGSRDLELGAHNPEIGGRDLELGAHNPEIGSRDLELGAHNPEIGGRDLELGAHNPEIGGRNLELGAHNPEIGAGNLETDTVHLETGKGRSGRDATVRPESFTPYPATGLTWPQGRF